MIWRLWNSREPERPVKLIKCVVMNLRDKFKNVDAHFNKLRIMRGEGVYWARDHHQQIVAGRVGVAKFIREGYADGRAIALRPMEHDILTSLLKRQLVGAATVNASNEGLFRTVACGLNKKFESILGERLMVSGPKGLCSYRLKPSLRVRDFNRPPLAEIESDR